MNKIETKQNPEPYKYYVRKPSSTMDKTFLDAVNRLMLVWDTCGSNHLDKMVEILKQMRNDNHNNSTDYDDLIDIFQSAKSNFIGKKINWFDGKPFDYTNKMPYLVWLLNGEARYKIIKAILPYMREQNHMFNLLVINEFATLQDIRDAFKAGIDIDKNCVSAFKNVLYKEYSKSDSNQRIHLNNLVRDIVFCIEHSSYMDNKQCVQSMYKQFNIPGTQVKKAEFMSVGEKIIQQDSENIIASVIRKGQEYTK